MARLDRVEEVRLRPDSTLSVDRRVADAMRDAARKEGRYVVAMTTAALVEYLVNHGYGAPDGYEVVE